MTADRVVKKCRFDNFGGYFSVCGADIIILEDNIVYENAEWERYDVS